MDRSEPSRPLDQVDLSGLATPLRRADPVALADPAPTAAHTSRSSHRPSRKTQNTHDDQQRPEHAHPPCPRDGRLAGGALRGAFEASSSASTTSLAVESSFDPLQLDVLVLELLSENLDAFIALRSSQPGINAKTLPTNDPVW